MKNGLKTKSLKSSKYFIYLTMPLKLFIEDVKSFHFPFHFDETDELCFNGYKIDNIKKCRKWSSIILFISALICMQVFKAVKSVIDFAIIDEIIFCLQNDNYFKFFLLSAVLIFLLLIVYFLLRLLSCYLSFAIFAKIHNNEENAQSSDNSIIDS